MTGNDQRAYRVIPHPASHEPAAWDPVPHLAALIDRLNDIARDPDEGSFWRRMTDLYAGPYAALRGGLLLDEPGREETTTEAALREVLAPRQDGWHRPPSGDTEMTAVYRYARSDRDYPAAMPGDQWPAADLQRAPEIMRRAIDAGQAEFRVRAVTR
jgi:hypothetical protein